MKRIVILLAACFAMQISSAQVKKEIKSDDKLEYGIPQPKSPNVDDILTKTISNIKDPQGVEISFYVSFKDMKNKIANGKSGSVTIMGNKFYLNSPILQAWYDGKNQWTYSRETKEVNITSPSDMDLADTNPMFMFNNYSKYYNAKYVRYTYSNIQQQYVHCIELTPKSENSDVQKISFNVFDGIYVPYMSVVYSKNGATTHVYMNKFDQQQKIDSNLFVFPKEEYKDAEVIDLR